MSPLTNAALGRFIAFIRERESVRIKKERGDPWPWTDDPILRAYRFCNVRREDDKETRLIHAHWLRPHQEDPDLWFAMAVARLVNWWPSLELVGYPVPWSTGKPAFIRAMDYRRVAGLKEFTGAYMVRADPHVSGSKATYIAEMVLSPMWEARAAIRPREGDTLRAFHTRLLAFKDMGPFIAGQIVADTKHGIRGPLRRSADWQSWATPGPGSLRGLARLYGEEFDRTWGKDEWWTVFVKLRDAYWLAVHTDSEGLTPWLDAQNLQNCLCEYDKYERVRLGQGQPRSRYTAPSTTP